MLLSLAQGVHLIGPCIGTSCAALCSAKWALATPSWPEWIKCIRALWSQWPDGSLSASRRIFNHEKDFFFFFSAIDALLLLFFLFVSLKRITSGTVASADLPDLGIVRDGTPCGNNLVCINKTCTSIHPYIDRSKCPSNNVALDCSGHGVCSNVNSCFCNPGWTGHDCSTQTNITYPGYNTQQEKEADSHYRQPSAITGAPPAPNGLSTAPPSTQTQNSKTTSYGTDFFIFKCFLISNWG